MLLTDADLYLPVSESTLMTVLDDALSWESNLQALDMPEIASLFLLAHLSALQKYRHLPAERVLAETVESCSQQVERNGLPDLITYALQHLDRKDVDTGFHLLPTFRIALLDDEAVKRKAYLSWKGLWDYGFQQRYRDNLASGRVNINFDARQHSLSAEQTRVYREFEAQKDEHMHIQGYAGTGKSSVIKSLLTLFEASSSQVLVLAGYKRQLDALSIDSQKMPNVRKCTFTELAEMVIPARPHLCSQPQHVAQ